LNTNDGNNINNNSSSSRSATYLKQDECRLTVNFLLNWLTYI